MVHEELVNILGADNVSTEEAELDKYSRDISFVSRIKPACVVKPRNADDIEKLVNLANKTLTPLIPVSSGSPHFKGDTVPSTGGAVIVDMSGFRKIVRVDRYNRSVMFESGVTFGELISAVSKEGMRLNMPLLPRETKSVVGSMLEREPVTMPKYHWDIADPMCDLEIVFGNGTLFRTGSAAGPGTIEEQWAVGGAQKEAAGPSSNSWHRVIQGSQGTMGIVTWASARTEILPRVEEPFLTGWSKLGRIMEMVHWLLRLRLVNECFILNNTNLASILTKKWPAGYQEIKSALPNWILFYNVAGYDYIPKKRVEGQTADIKDLTQRIGIESGQSIGLVSAYDLLKIVKEPCDDPYWKLRYKGACQDLFFISKYQNVEELANGMRNIAKDAKYPVSEMGIYIQPIVQGVNFHCEFNLFYDPDSSSDTERVRELYNKAVKSLMDKGAFFSRPYGEPGPMIMNRDAAAVAALHKVKRMLDPGNVMNPGKLCF